MKIRRYTPGDGAALERLNARLAAGGVAERISPEDESTPTPERCPDASVQLRCFVAEDGEEIRGSVWLKEQTFRVRGRSERLGWAKYPVGESLVDARFAGVPGALTFQVMRAQPRLMALGLGGHEGPFARLLAGMRWAGSSVPFYFLPLRPARVLRRLSHVRAAPGRRLALDALAATGLGWLGARLASAAARFPRLGSPGGARAEPVEAFGDWVGGVWERTAAAYPFLAERTPAALAAAYPASFPALVRLRVQRGGQDAAWLCALLRDGAGNPSPYFGSLRVGLLADGLGAPEDAAAVLAAGVRHLADAGADLVVSNQCHRAWRDGLRAAGFLPGPSRMAFYASARAGELLAEAGGGPDAWYLNQGDCDGPSLS